jgi:hypothetical protein
MNRCESVRVRSFVRFWLLFASWRRKRKSLMAQVRGKTCAAMRRRVFAHIISAFARQKIVRCASLNAFIRTTEVLMDIDVSTNRFRSLLSSSHNSWRTQCILYV